MARITRGKCIGDQKRSGGNGREKCGVLGREGAKVAESGGSGRCSWKGEKRGKSRGRHSI